MLSPEAEKAFSQTNFSTTDWIIVGCYMAISIVIGLFIRKFSRNMTNYIGAGRKVGPWLGIATMTGTELGLITVMYSAQKGFTGGFAAFHIALIAMFVTLLVGLSGFIVVPLRRLKVLTIPEFYERRFNRRVRILGGFLLAAGGILNMGLFLKVGSMFVVGITGLTDANALNIVMIVLLAIVLVYTTLGGMISVILTDYLQFVILAVGLLVGTWLAIDSLGWQNMFDTVRESKGEAGFDPTVEGSGFGLSYIAWQFVVAGLVSCAVWPTSVARALAMRSTNAVRIQFSFSSISFLIRFIIPYFWGIAAFVYITSSADGTDLDPLFFAGSEDDSLDNLYAMPVFLGRLLPPLFIGLVTAAMLAAFMSTHDSYLLCWSSVITQDIVAPLSGSPMTERRRVFWTRIIVWIIGGYVLFWGLYYEGKDDIWEYMSVSGAIYFTGALALLILGLYWKQASSTGAFAALWCGFLPIFGLEPMRRLVGLTYGEGDDQVDILSAAEIGLISVGTTFAVMISVSLLSPDKERFDLGSGNATSGS